MKISCPKCRQPIPADDVHLDSSLAKCHGCSAVFDFTDQVPRSARPRDARRSREVVAQPRGIDVADDGWGGLTITRRWFSPLVVFLLLFVIFWDGFLVVWYSIGLSTDEAGSGKAMMLLFPLLHVAVGLGLTYFVVAGFVNKTTIQCRDGRLTLAHGPLPWPGACDIDAGELEQLYVREKISRGRHGTNRIYQVRMKTKTGHDKKLVSTLTDAEQALYIEQQIEDHLGIADRAVRGEMR